MSEIIRGSVDVGRIEDHVRRAYRTAVARGGAIGAAAAARLKVPVADVDVALAAHRSATEAAAAAWATVQSEDAQSDVLIGGIRDAMWAALGRPGQSRYMSQVFPGGIGTYTKGDPRRQPVLMTLLESRIVACAAPQWSEDQRKEWAAAIADARKTYEAALAVHHTVEAASFVASASYRSAVKMAHEGLRAFKRDLQNLGLSRAQIFDIIPDGTPSAPAAPKATEPVVSNGAPVAATIPKADTSHTPA